MIIALLGQTWAQTPHPTQTNSSMLVFFVLRIPDQTGAFEYPGAKPITAASIPKAFIGINREFKGRLPFSGRG